uniref:Cadherin n=1 Tax=Schistosoma curassoni TaxID=6186 RepID=A0A183JXS2_9TREM
LIVGEQQNQDRVEDNNHIKLSDSNYLILGLPEDINVGSRIYRVQAIDFDSIDFSTINNPYQSYQSTHPRITVHYFIAQETDLGVKHYFRLGKEDGWIILIQRLDYESGPRNYILPIVAIDFGRPQLSSTLTLTIQVLDVNDEAPSITIRGIESTNINHNNYQRTIGHSTMDSFNPTHFQILAVRENSPIGTFIAKESGSPLESDYLKGLQNFALHHVEDDSIHSATISNNIEPTVSSSYIQHKQSSVLGRHDTEYILMTKTILNREAKNFYFIYLTCHDHVEKKSYLSYSLQPNNNIPSSTSPKRLSSTKLLKINILDENDNGPQFDRLRYEVKILENSIENTELIKLNAIDKDEESHIGYRFVQITDQFIQNYTDLNLSTIYAHFKIDSRSGRIKTTNIPLDREVKDSMIIPVIAYDDEFPSRTSHTWIHVEIEDVNDNIPKLTGNTTFWIDEEDTTMEHLINGGNHNRSSSSSSSSTTTLGTRQYHSTNHHIFIGRLNGEDYDIGENGKIIFKLGYENQYNINSPKWFLRSDGNLFVQSIRMYNDRNIDYNNNYYYLDREKTPFYEIPIIISDLGKNPTLSSTMMIIIIIIMIRLIPIYENSINTEPMEIINPYQNSTELITGLGIGLVIIILVCLLLLITYALHGVQTIRLNRNGLHIDRNKLHNNTMKQYQYKSDKSYNVLGMKMDIPFSNDWESVHSEFNPTNPNQKQISNDKKLNYANKTMNHQCIHPQISTFVPVMNSVEMDTPLMNTSNELHNQSLLLTQTPVTYSSSSSSSLNYCTSPGQYCRIPSTINNSNKLSNSLKNCTKQHVMINISNDQNQINIVKSTEQINKMLNNINQQNIPEDSFKANSLKSGSFV